MWLVGTTLRTRRLGGRKVSAKEVCEVRLGGAEGVCPGSRGPWLLGRAFWPRWACRNASCSSVRSPAPSPFTQPLPECDHLAEASSATTSERMLPPPGIIYLGGVHQHLTFIIRQCICVHIFPTRRQTPRRLVFFSVTAASPVPLMEPSPEQICNQYW